ncbi:MAG TPA: D-hexose-6-phosphate mutarotase [Cellvibrionales bacterium]|nr:D-hexose-6-phosphate mutarotase [Pseudomonadales bacterium]HCX27101.1 D-hexose-6-phosphate mutarotase [Cellvibrionales bacterium]
MLEQAYRISRLLSSAVYPNCRHVDGGLPLYIIENPLGRMVICEQGAQVLSFIPAGKKDLLWLSPLAEFKLTKPVRGGIPVCLPWFGVNQRDKQKPSHGFARNVNWQLANIEDADDPQQGACTRIEFVLEQFQQQPHSLFPYPFSARLTFLMSNSLSVHLQLTNTGSESLPLTWALHSYHPVASITSTRVTGLDNCEYLDNTCGLARKQQSGDVVFNGELDRAYINAGNKQSIISASPDNTSIAIEASGCSSAVVWNPGLEKAAAMQDMGAENYQKFVCVERGNVFDNEVMLLPNKTHRASLHIKL